MWQYGSGLVWKGHWVKSQETPGSIPRLATSSMCIPSQVTLPPEPKIKDWTQLFPTFLPALHLIMLEVCMGPGEENDKGLEGVFNLSHW